LLKEEIEVVVEANKVVEVQVENAKELGISSFSNLYPCGAFVSFNVYFPGSNF
jgi:hypothetical protein